MINELFNLVAPMAIYHRADVLFEPQAKRAYHKLKKITEAKWKSVDCIPPNIQLELNDLCDWAWGTYNILFEKIVKEYNSNYTFFIDIYGAKGVRCEDGSVVFSGDDPGSYPWYETAELIIGRLKMKM